MARVNEIDEANYLSFVQKNIELRESELESLHANASMVAASNRSQQALRDFYKNAQTPDPDNPYFVRVDLADGEIRYYGYVRLKLTAKSDPVPDPHNGVDDQLILSARSDGKGYTADYPENLPDLLARTRFMISGGEIVKISEEFFDGERTENSVIASEVVEASIQQTRHKKMQPISSTLQPDQFKITREPLNHSLAIQGPPGSGKTAVLLERLARIAFADEAVYQKGMLLIGPNKPFMEYVSNVLPVLGESEIALKSIDQLSEFAKEINSEIIESEDLIYLKGSLEIKEVLENIVEKQVKVISKSAILKIMDITIEFTPADSLRLIQSLKNESYSTLLQQRRIGETRIRNILVEKFNEGWIEKRGDIRTLQTDPALQISQESAFRTIVRNMFPPSDPVNLLSKLKSDAIFFTESAQDILGVDDQLIWLEESELQAGKITPCDIPILDYLDSLINDPVKKWGHIAIDEAQDLTPMEMTMVSRRLESNASLSIAGDLAQATGTQYYESWHDVLLLLEQEVDYTQKELRRSYRVPSEILTYAQQFLNLTGVRVSPSEPFLERPGSLSYLETKNPEQGIVDAITLAEASLNNQESVLIVASKADRAKLAARRFQDIGSAYVRIMEPTEVKGLEFDAVIILNPELIIEDYPWDKSRLARLFYVLTTRSTKRLCLIGSDSLSLQYPLMYVEYELDLELEASDTEAPIALPAASGKSIEENSSEPLEPGLIVRKIQDTPKQKISIVELCEELNVNITQASGDFMEGHWLFTGTSQIRCHECGDKPQLIFAKHSEGGQSESDHRFAVGCPGCFVVRNFDSTKHGELLALQSELKVSDFLKTQCPSCGDN